jgi:Lamin Tail Domain
MCGRIPSLAACAAAAVLAACAPSRPGGDGCKTQLVPGDLVITEVFADFKASGGGAGTDTGKEWFEIYNTTSHAIDLEGLLITHSRPDGAKPNVHAMTGGTIEPRQFFTLGNAPA